MRCPSTVPPEKELQETRRIVTFLTGPFFGGKIGFVIPDPFERY
jgi:hypothetical protein